MLLRRLGHAIVVLGVAVGGCNFEPSGTAIDGGDGATVDAIDAPGEDAIDAPVDAVDGMVPDACVPDPLGERCNGLDDDCDLTVDETFPAVGAACDGPDSDLCLDDLTVCNSAGDGTTCGNPTPDDDVERCNGVDDDCDIAIDETFSSLGQTCDGTDGDLCIEGTVVCSADGSGVTCSDTTPTTAEACNTMDDDCDSRVDEDFPTLGTMCDGSDGDSCTEGTFVCNGAGNGVACTDMTGTIAEACNNADDDCDLTTDEGFDLNQDLGNCGVCGRQCTNPLGTTVCDMGTCAPTCSAGSNDCDGNPINGCELRNTDPPCGTAVSIGNVNGDQGAQAVTRTGATEAFFRVRVNDSISGNTPLLAQVQLTSAAGTNFDLFVTCMACGGDTLSSTNLTGTDTVNIGRTDSAGDRSYDILIGVRWMSSTACGDWSLTVTGNVATGNRTCD